MAFLVVAALLGGAGMGLWHHAAERGVGPGGMVCIGLGFWALLWPLSWVATMRIVWPLRALAASAADLTQGRLDARSELPESPGEVGEVAGALRNMADRVARQLQDQRSLMAAVSHELRSPLARARVLVELSREGAAPADVHDQLEAEIEAMDELIGDLLAAARIDFEAVSPRPMAARELATRAISLAGQPESALILEQDAEVHVDPTLGARALGGLLDNGRRYGGQHVQLRVRVLAQAVRFEVEDDGPGFAPGEEEAAFQPFWRGPARAGETRPRGEGLGLALVRQIAEAHQGRAGAENRPEGGARVWVELPRA